MSSKSTRQTLQGRQAKVKRQEEDELEFLLNLEIAVIHDVMKFCGVKAVDVARDVRTINNRARLEGITFLTSTLPQLGKAVLSAFQSGRFERPSAFKSRGRSALPAFLSGLTKRCFDDVTGAYRGDAAGSDVVYGLVQICNLLKKYERPYTQKQMTNRLNKMKQVEEELPKTFTNEMSVDCRSILALARDLVTEIYQGVDLSNIVPGVGPGSTAAGMMSRNEKFKTILNTKTLPDGYDVGEYASVHEAFFDPDETSYSTSRAIYLEKSGDYVRGSRVCLVNKDSGGPRGISIEPLQQMFVQQGQRRLLEAAACSRSQHRINFKDQGVNAKLALESSLTGKHATLDMSDASDRVSVALVTELFGDLPNVLPYLLASRSKFTTYAGDEGHDIKPFTLELKKFAPMGSAVCFPVESVCFWSLSVAVLVYGGCDPMYARRNVYTYGDDLIVPCAWSAAVMDALEQFCLVFNRAKCFTTGPFRESCGTDAFKGDVVTPIKVKALRPISLDDVESITAWCEYANAFARQWMWETSYYITDYLRQFVGELPMCYGSIGLLTSHTFSTEFPVKQEIPASSERSDLAFSLARLEGRSSNLAKRYRAQFSNYQASTVSGLAVRTYKRKSEFDELAGLFDWLCTRGSVEEPYEVQRGKPTLKLVRATVSIS